MKLTIILIFCGLSSYSLVQTKNFTLPKTDIVHVSSGLIFHYLSDYKPSNRIIAVTVSLIMVPDMCYLIPIKSMKKIPQCRVPTAPRNQSKQTNPQVLYEKYMINVAVPYRRKRFLTDVISIGIGTAALTLSTVNTVQIANLRAETNRISNSLDQLEQAASRQTAQILHLKEGQLQLAHELNYTQAALNKTISLVNEHTEILKTHESALQTLSSMAMFISNRLTSFVHAVETHFIHTSIDNILSNQLNLQFIHHKDLPAVADLVLEKANITFDDSNSILSPIELVTRLLVQQQIDFVPVNNKSQHYNNNDLIGRLIFTSYFAVPEAEQLQFALYELVPVPFNYNNHRVQLAQMPYILGIEPNTNHFIRWSKDEARSCNFIQMATCRETPAIRTDLTDQCIYEILNDETLADCRIESHSEQVFVHRIGQHWAISTNSTTKCHPIQSFDIQQFKVISNQEIILPPVALIATLNSTSLACDHFVLPGSPTQVGPAISLIENTTVLPIQQQLIDLNSKLNNHTNWVKLPYIPPHLQTLFDFVSNNPTQQPLMRHVLWHSAAISCIGGVLIIGGIIFVAILFHRTRSGRISRSNVTIKLPSTKSGEEMILTNLNRKD